MAVVEEKCITSSQTCTDEIHKYRINEAPATVYYIPNFVSKLEEEQLLEKVYKVPKPKWTQLSNRRLQNWGGIPHPNGMLVEQIPEWLSFYLDKVWHLGVFEELCKPNHVLINEYLAGQGIMPHFDGPLFYPTITTLSLGSHTVLDFYVPRTDDSEDSKDAKMLKLLSLLVEPRSLLILKDEMYSQYLHGIEERETDNLSTDVIKNWSSCELSKKEYQDKTIIAEFSDKNIMQALHRKTRISLTMRHVPKTSKLKIKLGR